MPPRSVLLRNGDIYTPADPFATAMLTIGDRVAWVGAEGAAAAHIDGVDQVVDLDGALVTPAFVDAHVHTTETGLALDGVDLTGCRSLGECLDRLATRATTRPGAVIFGHGWDETDWPERRPPTRAEVDRAISGGIAYLSRVDVHSAVVSSALIGQAPEIAEQPGYETSGLVSRDAHHAARRVSRDQLSDGSRRDLQRLALQQAASRGIGCIHEIAAPHIAGAADVAGLRRLVEHEPLPDVLVYWGELGSAAQLGRLGALGAAGDLCLDGSLGSHSARLSQPYADAADERGYLYIDLDAAAQHVIEATKAHVQAGFHAIGDEAIRTAVEAIGRAAEVCGLEAVIAARHRLEHLEMVAPNLIEEMSRLGVVASVQPRFDALWGGDRGMYSERLGQQRALAMNPFAALSRAGVIMAFGSDSPVTPLDPWQAVRAAAYHQTPEHRITVRAAFSAHTRGGWRAARIDDAGVLAPGLPASYAVWQVAGDLLVQAPDERIAAWSTNPRSGVPRLPDLTPGQPTPVCLRTVVRGETIYEAAG